MWSEKYAWVLLLLLLPQFLQAQVTLSLTYQEKNGLTSVQAGGTYTMQLNYSVSSTTGNATGVKIEVPLPDEIYDVTDFVGTSHAPVGNFVFNNVLGAKKLTINFINPVASGSNGVLEFGIRVWNLTTPNNTLLTTTAELTATGGYTSGIKTHNITVTAIPRICASKTLLGGGALDNVTTYRILVKTGGYANQAPLGTLQATSLILKDTLPAGAQFISADIYNASGTLIGTGTESGGIVTANLPDLSFFVLDYTGVWQAQSYWVDIAVQFNSPAFSAGNVIRNIATIQYTPYNTTQDTLYHGENIGGTCTTDLEEITTLSAPVTSANLTFTGVCGTTIWGATSNVYPDNSFDYHIGFSNTGNVPLNNVEIIDSIPPNIRLDQSGAYHGVRWDAGQYLDHVAYQTNLTGGTWVSYTPTSGYYTVPVLPSGEYFTKLKFVLVSPFPANTSLNGYNVLTFRPAYEPASSETVNNCVYWNSSSSGIPPLASRTNCNTCYVLQPRPATSNIYFAVSNAPSCGSTLSVGQNITFSGTYSTNQGFADATQPICAMFIPHGYQFISDAYNAGTSGLATPTLQIIPNYIVIGGVTKDLYRWTFPTGSVMPYGTTFSVSATVQVTGSLQAGTGYITDFVATAANASAHQPENIWGGTLLGICEWDLDGDTTETHPITTSNFCCYTCYVAGSAAMESRKWVRGELDENFSRYPDYGSTVQGGEADYRLIVKNIGNVPMKDITVIDVLPFVGDVGVIDPSPRNTQWRPNLAGPIAAPAGITVYYSTASNPCRDEVKQPLDPSPFPTGCTAANWSITPPLDITTVQAVKIEFGSTILAGGDSLLFHWPMRAPVDAPINNEIAWNSFGFAATRTDNNTPLIPAEPIKVGIKVQAPSPAIYGDRVWLDTDHDGAQDAGEVGVSGVLVDIYRDNGDGVADINVDSKIDFTITDDNGNYLFPNLMPGDYFAHFILPLGYTVSPTDAGGNDALDSDGETTIVTHLVSTEDDRTWDLGIYPAASCDVEIYNYTVSECVFTSGSSQATVNVFVAWNNAPAGQLINVTATGATTQTINPATATSPQLVSFQIPADALEHTISAAFSGGCASGTSAYSFFAPAPCFPLSCDLKITDVKTSLCMPDAVAGHALVDVWLEWSNEPYQEDILVTVAGQTDTVKVSNGIYPPVLVTFEVPANGASGNVITATFDGGSCSDTDTYNAPTPCYCTFTPSLSKSNDLSCATPTATLSVSPIAGANYLWDDGSTSATRVVSSAGAYSVIVVDALNNCTGNASVTVTSTISTPPCVPVTVQKTK